MTEDAATPARTSDAGAWASIAFLIAAVMVCGWLRPMAIAPASLVGVFTACGVLFGAAAFYRTMRPRENFAVMCVALGQVILFSALGVILSYMLARGNGALWDAALERWDRALGFDWLAYVRWIDHSAVLSDVFKIAYASLIPQIIILVVALGFTVRVVELRTVMLAAILCGSICIFVSALVPATSYAVAYGMTGRDFAHINPWGGYLFMTDFRALRDGSFATLSVDEAEGIIAFPSYHAGLSLVTMWGFWNSRMTWLRWSGLTLAALTIAATPVQGGHYLVDVIAGLAIALCALLIAVRAVRWVPTWPRLTASPFRRSHAASGQ